MMCGRGLPRQTAELQLADRFTPEMISQSVRYLTEIRCMVEIEGRLSSMKTINADL